jgi:hypothetical protein
MIVDVDFLDHWRTRLVVDQLGGDEFAPLYILRIWAHCQTRKSVRFEGMTAAGLRSLCRYTGDADRLEAALKEGGFVVRNGTAIEVPKWAKHNAALISAWENGAKGGRPPKQKENPEETDGKPMGSEEKPKPNPLESDKRRQEGTRGDPIASKGIGNTSVNGEHSKLNAADVSPLPLNARRKGKQRKVEFVADLSHVDWDRVAAMAEAVARKIPPTNTTGRRCWLKYAVLAQIAFSEDWLMGSVAAVLNAKATRKTKQAHFTSILQSKAQEKYGRSRKELEGLMDSIEIPDDTWNDQGILEIRK